MFRLVQIKELYVLEIQFGKNYEISMHIRRWLFIAKITHSILFIFYNFRSPQY